MYLLKLPKISGKNYQPQKRFIHLEYKQLSIYRREKNMYPNQNQGQVQNKPTAAYILSLLGGILGLLASLAFIGLGALAYSALSSFDNYYASFDIEMFGWGWATLIGFGAWMLITSILVIVFARKLNANPLEHTKWGALILIFSIIGVGGLLAFIGGILALVYKPILVGSQPQYTPQQQYGPPPQNYAPPPQQPITRICPNCGKVLQENLRFCPNCGKQLN
jgi:hypothetical protein